jgi:hypothetical protein
MGEEEDEEDEEENPFLHRAGKKSKRHRKVVLKNNILYIRVISHDGIQVLKTAPKNTVFCLGITHTLSHTVILYTRPPYMYRLPDLVQRNPRKYINPKSIPKNQTLNTQSRHMKTLVLFGRHKKRSQDKKLDHPPP